MTRHFEPESIIVAYCLAMVITLATVGLSAYRVSRLNIASAVRDLPTAPPSVSEGGWRQSLVTLVFHVRRIAATPQSLLQALTTFRPQPVSDAIARLVWSVDFHPCPRDSLPWALALAPAISRVAHLFVGRAADLRRHRLPGRMVPPRCNPHDYRPRPDAPLRSATHIPAPRYR